MFAVHPRWILVTQIVSLVVIGTLSALLVRQSTDRPEPLPYLAKRLFVDHPNDIIIDFSPLRESLNTYVSGLPVTAGIYFEYLTTGTSININGKHEFYRASLVKLPVVMRTYKYIEQGKLSLDDVLTVESKQIDKNYGHLWERGVGTKLTVRELIRYVLQDSDNTAFNVLYEKVNVQLRGDGPGGDAVSDDIYDYLDIPRATSGITPMITPKNYSSILKSLFFAAYLRFEHSNDILQVMSGEHQEHWLRRGIRDGIPVADKIGVYNAEPASQHVFSDCGIVYYPERNYILCVMINTNDQSKASDILQSVSQRVFDYIDQRP